MSLRSLELFDLCLFEYDMLARDGVEFLQLELVGLRARVLFRDVVEAGIGAADQFYKDGVCLRHSLGLSAFEASED